MILRAKYHNLAMDLNKVIDPIQLKDQSTDLQ